MRRKVIGRRGMKSRNLNRRRAIRHHCLACSNFRWEEVVNCRAESCSLFPFRQGVAEDKGLSPEQRSEAIRRFCRKCLGPCDPAQIDCHTSECALFDYRK